VGGERGQGDPTVGRDMVQQLALVLTELGVVAAVQRAPHAPEGTLETFRIRTVHRRNEMIGCPAMIEVIVEGSVAAAPEVVWPLVSDPARMPEWFAFGERIEVLAGDGVGQRRRMHGHWGKKASEIDQELTAWEPPRRLAWRHVAERLDGRPAPRFAATTEFSIEIAPEPGGSRVRMRSAQVPASAPRGLVIRAFGRREVRGALDRSLEALAARC
jgi:uncharacterized protein YndB with AHSA1/START domain